MKKRLLLTVLAGIASVFLLWSQTDVVKAQGSEDEHVDTKNLAEPSENTSNISEHLQIDLLELEKMGQEVNKILVGAIKELRDRQEAVANATRVVEINQRRFNIGTAAAIEVLQAKAGVAGRQIDLITARTSIQNAEGLLKSLIEVLDESRSSSKSDVPPGRPSPVEVD